MTVDRYPLEAFTGAFADATARSDGRLDLGEQPGWGALNVRIDPAASAPLAAVLGTELPTEPNTVRVTRTGLVAWLGPDEWLVLAPNGLDELESDLRAAAADQPASFVDVSAGRTVIQLAGPAARTVLAHGCALDLDAGHFRPGACAQTRLALANVILIAPPHQGAPEFGFAPQFLILVRASFAAYLATWLLDAATEYLR